MPHLCRAAPNSLVELRAHATGTRFVLPWHRHDPAMAPAAKGAQAPDAMRLEPHNDAGYSSLERRLHSQEPKAHEQDRFVVI